MGRCAPISLLERETAAPGQRETLEGDFDSGPPLRQYDSRPLAGPPIVPLLLTVGPADRQVQSTRRPGPILESASLFLPLAALRRIPRKRLACSATGGAAPLSPILDFTPGDGRLVVTWQLPLTTHGAAAEREAEPIRSALRMTSSISSRADHLKFLETWCPRPTLRPDSKYPALTC